MLTVAISKRNKLQNIIVLTPKDGDVSFIICSFIFQNYFTYLTLFLHFSTCLSELSKKSSAKPRIKTYGLAFYLCLHFQGNKR